MLFLILLWPVKREQRLDNIDFETDAFYVMDKAYTDFKRFFEIDQTLAYFVIRSSN